MNETAEYYSLWMLLSKVALGSMLLPIFMAILYFKVKNKALRVFFFYLITTFIVALGEQLVYKWLVWLYDHHPDVYNSIGIKNMNFYNIFYLLKDFLFLGYFFYLLNLPKKIARWILTGSIVLVVITLINYLFIQGIYIYGSFNSTVLALFNFILPVFYMWILYHSDAKIPLSKNPYFWINLGLIIPNLLGLYLYFAGDKIHDTDFLPFCQIMIVRSIIEILSQILITIGFAYGRYAQFLR